jgi:hypothetical protein
MLVVRRQEFTRSAERAMAGEPIFELGDVRITPYIAQFAGTSYQIASIGSVRVIRGRRLDRVAVIVFVLGVGLFVAAMVRSSGNPELAEANFPLAASAVIVMFAAYLLQLVWPSQVSKLLLRILWCGCGSSHLEPRTICAGCKAGYRSSIYSTPPTGESENTHLN